MLNELRKFLKTLTFFLLACFMLPLLLLTFLSVHYVNCMINYLLSISYTDVIISRSKKIRSLIDTPRNAGIFNFLLCVNGTCDIQQIKQKYNDNLLEQRDKQGLHKFPKLRQMLTTRWGQYAWIKDTSNFHINNHVLLNSRAYRGRAVTDANIQEFVSEQVTKYIPAHMPQWQVNVIPTTTTTTSDCAHYYILVKVHHLIIAEEKDLHISELLMLQLPNEQRAHCITLADDMEEAAAALPWQYFSHFVHRPRHIVKLYRHLKLFIIKQWNAFIYEFDSLDAHDDCLPTVTVNNVSKLLSLLLIICVNSCNAYWKWWQLGRSNALSAHFSMFVKLLNSQLHARHLSWTVAAAAMRATLHPTNIAIICLKLFFILLILPVSLPYYLLREIFAILCLLLQTKPLFQHSYAKQLMFCAKLMLCALGEFLQLLNEIFKTPLNIYEELFAKPTHETNILHRKSYSGRKIVSFTKSIDAAKLQKRNTFGKTITEYDLTLACLAAAIRDYFALDAERIAVPAVLNATCRTIFKAYFTDNKADKLQHIGGVVFLQLPLKKPSAELAEQIHKIIDSVRSKQSMIYLASIGQTKFDLITALLPQVITKVFINFFAYNFPVTITDIRGPKIDFTTIWGQNVEDVLLFRPPQSKTSLSLNLHRFGDRIRLAVMADTQLGPDHKKISQAFEHYLEQISI